MNKPLLHIALPILLVVAHVASLAHEGHEHGAATVSAPANSHQPQRLPDGSVFLPKQAQRRLAVHTLVAEQGEHPQAVELNGHVVMNPKFGGKVQAVLAGRIEPGPKGLPLPGQAVRQGELLAYVRPAVGSAERSSQLAQQAELRATRALAQQNLARLRELEGSVPRREIEAQQAELASLDGRLTAIAGGIEGRDALRAPVSGVLASVAVVAGQVVEAKELLFEVIDPAQLLIEAQAFDAALLDNLLDASLLGEAGKLRFIGGSRVLRDGALPLLFRAEQASQTLALGQPVKLIARTRSTSKGVALPASAIVRNPANETIVWLHVSAERFAPAPVKIKPLSGSSVLVQGIAGGARVVTDGATLLNQIR